MSQLGVCLQACCTQHVVLCPPSLPSCIMYYIGRSASGTNIKGAKKRTRGKEGVDETLKLASEMFGLGKLNGSNKDHMAQNKHYE